MFHSESIPSVANASRRRQSPIYLGIRPPSRKGLPFHIGRISTLRSVIFLPSGPALVLTPNTKTLPNQTYTDVNAENIGSKFDIEQVSPIPLTGFYQ